MINKIYKILGRINKKIELKKEAKKIISEREEFLNNGKIPWSKGYVEYKKENIIASITDVNLLEGLSKKILPINFGHRIDERSVEYPWIFSNLPNEKLKVLDAGSTFNFDFILDNQKIKGKDLTIYTFAPESKSYNDKRISYVYGDLRDLPFKDNLYDIVVSHSTIEHIDMDNSMYGYDLSHNENVTEKSYSYLVAVNEMIRVLKHEGKLLLTFPFGKFENHGFFQQFDDEMLARITDLFDDKDSYELTFFKYENDGWVFSSQNELKNAESFNPHTGIGKKDDNAAHSRGVVCVSYVKK